MRRGRRVRLARIAASGAALDEALRRTWLRMSTSRPTLAVAAIVKNEAPYLLEWIAHHRNIGVERFFIADNNSNDGTTELLRELALHKIVDHIPYPGKPGTPPQVPAYRSIIEEFGDCVDWIAFIDADEFIVADDPDFSIPGFLEQLPDDVGASPSSLASAYKKASSAVRSVDNQPQTGAVVPSAAPESK